MTLRDPFGHAQGRLRNEQGGPAPVCSGRRRETGDERRCETRPLLRGAQRTVGNVKTLLRGLARPGVGTAFWNDRDEQGRVSTSGGSER